jgi:peptide chain release factor 2
MNRLVDEPNFWDDSTRAQAVMRERTSLDKLVNGYRRIERELDDALGLAELAEGEGDQPMLDEAQKALDKLKTEVKARELESLLSGEADANDAYLEVHSGAGGTEAQDWAEMLLRMYMRWAERHDCKVEWIEESAGEGAGIKSATVKVMGENAYGWLKTESGVHRLVRISPFDANARRHTSFASVFVYPQVDDEIKIDIKPDDLRIDTFRSGGAGGQHVNMTDSAVRIVHLPTNIVVQCQNERSQHKNRDSAMKQLRARLYEFELEKKRVEAAKTEASKLDINFGSQIRSYVLAPYRMIKDHRTKLAIGDVDRVLEGDLEPLIHAYLVFRKTGKTAGDGKDDLPE